MIAVGVPVVRLEVNGDVENLRSNPVGAKLSHNFGAGFIEVLEIDQEGVDVPRYVITILLAGQCRGLNPIAVCECRIVFFYDFSSSLDELREPFQLAESQRTLDIRDAIVVA